MIAWSSPLSLFHVLYQVMICVELDLEHTWSLTLPSLAPCVCDRSHLCLKSNLLNAQYWIWCYSRKHFCKFQHLSRWKYLTLNTEFILCPILQIRFCLEKGVLVYLAKVQSFSVKGLKHIMDTVFTGHLDDYPVS